MRLLSSELTLLQLCEIWQTNILYAASDGSVLSNKGTFGWILSDHSGHRLVECSGAIFGYPISSFRSESFGIWSILLFLQKLFEFFSIPLPTNHLQLVCDNKSLVNTIKKIQNQARPMFPNDTLASDWDIVNEIIILCKNLEPSIAWIKGHQDDERPVEKLPLPAQLNCEADALADKAHEFPQNSSHRGPNNSI